MKDVEKLVQSMDKSKNRVEEIVAIGTSTGGPKTLEVVIRHLPSHYPYPILVVQHMPSGFTKAMADRLNAISSLTVSEAIHGEVLEPGHVYIAPGNHHMQVKRSQAYHYFLQIDGTTPPRGGHRPSVDVLFESLAPLHEVKKTIILLTGMGSDGTAGLRKIKEVSNPKEVTAIGESEESCVVFGMPKAAIEEGLIDLILTKEKIAEYLRAKVSGR